MADRFMFTRSAISITDLDKEKRQNMSNEKKKVSNTPAKTLKTFPNIKISAFSVG